MASLTARGAVPPVAGGTGPSASKSFNLTIQAKGLTAGIDNMLLFGQATTTPAVYGDLTAGFSMPDSEATQLSFRLTPEFLFDVTYVITNVSIAASPGDQFYCCIHQGTVTVDPSTELQVVGSPLTVVA